MTLNETHIRELLEHATPGPWHVAMLDLHRDTGVIDNEHAVANQRLAALAPELARDWLRMRNDLGPATLNTVKDYENAPAGTIVARNEKDPFVKNGPGNWWDTYHNMFDEKELAGTSRKVLRWGWGEQP